MPIDSILALNPAFRFTAEAGLESLSTLGVPVVVDNDPVGRLIDRINGLSLTQAAAANRPFFKPGLANGRPTLRFDGVNDTLAGVLSSFPQPYTIIAVFYPRAATGSYFDSRSGQPQTTLFASGTLRLHAGTDLTTTPTIIARGLSVVVCEFNGASSVLTVDGVERARGNANTNAFTGLTLGGDRNGGTTSKQDWCEFVVFSRSLTDAEKLSATEYLCKYWNATGVGSGTFAGRVYGRVQYGGLDAWSFLESATLAGGSTYVSDRYERRCRVRGGAISALRISVGAPGTDKWKAKVFRSTTTGAAPYAFVEERVFTPVAGTQTVEFATPLNTLPGDVLGVYVPADGTLNLTAASGTNTSSATGDVTVSTSFGGTATSGQMSVEFRGAPPKFAVTGDSIVEGHNATPNQWHGYLHTGGFGVSGTPSAEPAYSIYSAQNAYSYVNCALGGQTWAWVASTGMVEATKHNPQIIWIHCGVNDAAAARTVAAVQADIDTCYAQLLPGQRMVLTEVLADSSPSGTDAASLRAREYNAMFATWAADKPRVTVVAARQALADIRTSTGSYDDLKVAYRATDLIHLSLAGVGILAGLVKTALDTVFAGVAVGVPSGLAVAPGNGTLGVSWNALTTAFGSTGYELDLAGTTVDAENALSYTWTGRTNGTSYAVRVRAYDSAGNRGAWSSAVSAAPQLLSASELNSLAAAVVGSTSFATLAANALAAKNNAAAAITSADAAARPAQILQNISYPLANSERGGVLAEESASAI